MNAILNTSIVTGPGNYELKAVTLDDVKLCMMQHEYVSAVGHQATADILTELTGYEVAVNRFQWKQEPGDTGIVFKLRGRAPEGAILTREQVEEIGYDFFFLLRFR